MSTSWQVRTAGNDGSRMTRMAECVPMVPLSSFSVGDKSEILLSAERAIISRSNQGRAENQS